MHLRIGDGLADQRKGLDEASIQALSNYLPRGNPTYLVTNKVEWYEYFETHFGLSHPKWQSVHHSVLKHRMKWGNPKTEDYYKNPNWTPDELNMMQTYADWYTVLIAEKVYHTYSDFSISAIHWMNIESRTYSGIDPETSDLQLLQENWIIDGETPPLVARSESELRQCD